MGIKRISAPDGTLLGRLREASETLAEALDWEPYAATHHLLTGGVMASKPIQPTTRYRMGPDAFGDDHPMTMEIPDPESATQQDLISAFNEERSRIAPPWNRNRRQRSRKSPKSERVAAFVKERPGMKSPRLLSEWNRLNPNEQYRSDSIMRRARRLANIAK